MRRFIALRAAGTIFIIVSVSLARAAGSPDPASPPAVGSGSPTPSPTPVLYLPQTLAELKRLQQAALESDYAYRQVAHLSNNIGPRLSGSGQAQKAVDYVA